MYQVRAVSLSNYLGVANAVGLDGKAMLRLVGLTPEMLRDPERRVPAGAATAIVPPLAGTSRSRARAAVDLPEPLSPTSARVSPG